MEKLKLESEEFLVPVVPSAETEAVEAVEVVVPRLECYRGNPSIQRRYKPTRCLIFRRP